MPTSQLWKMVSEVKKAKCGSGITNWNLWLQCKRVFVWYKLMIEAGLNLWSENPAKWPVTETKVNEVWGALFAIKDNELNKLHDGWSPHSTVYKILLVKLFLRFNKYKYQLLQFVTVQDREVHYTFCCVLSELDNGLFIAKTVLVTKPISFSLGMLTDNRIWGSSNRHAVIEGARDGPKLSVSVLYIHTKSFWAFLCSWLHCDIMDEFPMLILRRRSVLMTCCSYMIELFFLAFFCWLYETFVIS